ncbi:MAG: glycosyltransferase [Chlorobium sp.]|jgi:glycosyltransferase involved in cell wall biosynthesis|nr:glycosyltransferase [Chlorobium sp.]
MKSINTPLESQTLQYPWPRQQLFIDVSVLVRHDTKTGIQRVVRSVLMELLEHPPEGLCIEPVYLELDELGVFYRYARHFTRNLTDRDSLSPFMQDTPIEINKGDIFLGLDLCYHVRHGRNFFKRFRQAGGRVYFVVYDLLPILFPHFFPKKSARQQREWIRVVAENDGVLCISRAVADDVKKLFDRIQPFRYTPFHIGWFHLGADIEQSLPTQGLPYGFEKDLLKLAAATTILMVGTVEPRKAHLLVLKAFEILWLTGTRANLIIVGKKGWLVKKVANRMKRHNKLNPRFYWYQGLSDEALLQLYARVDGVMMASEGEGFGLPLIEAAQYGCPILARDLPVFREVADGYATYFSGNSPVKLASVLKSWIGKLKSGSAPQSSEMSWMTWKESADQIIKLLTDSRDSNWVHRWERIGTSKPAEPPMRSYTLKTIAVDLTPIVGEEESSDRRMLVFKLLHTLAEMKPETRFILLTRERSYNELSYLDSLNIQRIIVRSHANAGEKVEESEKRARDFLARIKNWSTRLMGKLKNSTIKRIGRKKQKSGSRLKDLGVDLLFCPFTSMELAEPEIPSVTTIYDLQHKTSPKFFDASEIAHHDRMFKEAVEQASALMTTSEYWRQTAITYGNLDPSCIRIGSFRLKNCDLKRMAQEYWDLFEDALRRGPMLPKGAWAEWQEKIEPACAPKEPTLTVSIVTPSLNQGQFIERTLLSVASQRWLNLEHIVFDGGSTDQTIEVLTRFSPAVRWVSEKDEGKSCAINKGFRAATGDIIGWLNSNDIYYPDAIRRVMAFFETHPEIDVVYGMADHIDEYDRPFESYPTKPWNPLQLQASCFICQPALFFRRRLIEQHGLLDESLHYCMDYEYWLRLAHAGVLFAYLNEKLAGSRLYAANKTSRSRMQAHREINDMLHNHLGKVPEPWIKKYARASMQKRLDGRTTSQAELTLRYAAAKLRWTGLRRKKISEITWHTDLIS